VAKSLGVFVSSNQHFDKIIKLCKAAKKKNVDVTIFFTHLGTLLTQEKRFDELIGLAGMTLCKVAFERQGLRPPVPGIGEEDFATQARHAEVIEECDRYVVF
jgi:predicted peroxiredoxin